ncbi:MAG: Gfo/Idh/MocA family oxidoreductase [Chloroflexota bacterium]|nr:MAG: Gfo/Idh/MocA family oxidoreductase [Chloroflexota bacterium]
MADTRIGIIGGGGIAREHCRAYRAVGGARIVAVAEVDEARGQEFAREQNCVWHSDWRALLDRPDIDAVSICLPHSLHAAATIDAARAGKDILCEKPIATALDDADAAIAACHAAGVRLMVGHTHRFRREHIVALELLRSGAIGQVHQVRDVIWAGREAIVPLGWRGVNVLNGGGVFMDNGIHAADRLIWWVGARPTWVAARMSRATTIVEGEDLGVALIGFANGVTATLEQSFAVPRDAGQCDATFVGSEGVLRVETWRGLGYARIGEAWKAIALPEGGLNGFDAEIAEFLSAIREKRAPSVTGEDGRAALELIQAIYRSARSGTSIDL